MDFIRLIHKKNFEKILHITRRHYVTFVPVVFLFILLILVPIGVYWLISQLYPNLLIQQPYYQLLVLFISLYYLSLCIFFYSYFIDFYLDILIVTNDRLVDIDQKGLFARTVCEIELYQIQDVTSEVEGFFPSLFGYGNLVIQTASAIPKLLVHNIPFPHSLRQELLDLADEDKKYHRDN